MRAAAAAGLRVLGVEVDVKAHKIRLTTEPADPDTKQHNGEGGTINDCIITRLA